MIIQYKGPARRYPGAVNVEFPEETDFELIEFIKVDTANHVPFPLVVAKIGDDTYVMEDDDYCRYHDICVTCRRGDCDKKCIPEFAKYN